MSTEEDKSVINTIMVVLGILAVIAIGFYFAASTVTSDDDDEGGRVNERAQTKILENIKPVGQVNIGAVAAVAATTAAASGPRSGDAVYTAHCLACHSTGVAGAPKTGDTAGWSARAAKGMDGLLATAISGINAMPPKGTCAACSDDELKAAIQHMLTESGL
ncbi:MAG: c-type cytochrome [Gammaproteobacteria bacterium]